jgi:AraC-like DNA-binding protein
MVIDGPRVTAEAVSTLFTLRERRLLVRTYLYLSGSTEEALTLAWRGPRSEVVPVFGTMHLLRELRAVKTARISWQVGRYLITATGAEGDAARLILMLADNADACSWSTRMISDRLGLGRSALYAALRECGLPPLEQILYLFRLLPAARMIQQGASVEDAAFRTSYSDGASLRKSLRKRLRVTLGQLRADTSWEHLVANWLQAHNPRRERCVR